jgi:hypothetical protein
MKAQHLKRMLCMLIISPTCTLNAQRPQSPILFDAIRSNDSPRFKRALPKAVLEDKEEGDTALSLAACLNRLQMVQDLLAVGMDRNVQDPHGWTPLMDAIRNDNREIGTALLELYPDENPCDLELENHQGQSALVCAAYFSNLFFIELLLKHDANTEHADHEGQTALYIATLSYALEIIIPLLEHGAKIPDVLWCNLYYIDEAEDPPCALLTKMLFQVALAGSRREAYELCENNADEIEKNLEKFSQDLKERYKALLHSYTLDKIL